MHSGTRRALLLASGLMLAAPATAAEPAALAKRAGEQCASGEIDGAAETLRALLSELESDLGPANDASQVVRLNLAHVERARGRTDEAARLEAGVGGESSGKPERALSRALRELRACASVAHRPEAEAPELALDQRVNLARNQINRGKYPEALKVLEDARASADARAIPTHLMSLYETLALVELQLGHEEKARTAAAAADRIASEQGETEVRITLARLAMQLGDLDEAGTRLASFAGERLDERTRAELWEALGDLELRLGNPKAAQQQLERALSAHRTVFGADHASTAAVANLRGDAYRLAGDLPAALASYREALRIRSAAHGEAHAETARTRNAIGVLQADLGDWKQADASFAKALAALEQALGGDHPEILTVRANRALASWGAAESAAAAASYAKVVEALEQRLGADHPSVAAAVRNLARMELDLGRADRAQQLLDTALAAQTRSLGAEHPALAPTRLARARLLALRGALAEAASEADRAIASLVNARGAEHPVVVRARTLRSRIAAAQGDGATAFSQAQQASRALAGYTRRTFGAISDRQRSLLTEDAEAVLGALLSAEDAPARELFVALLPHRDSVLRSIAASRAADGRGDELAALRRRYVAAVLGSGSGASQRAEQLAGRIDALEARAAGGAAAPERDPEDVLRRACRRLPGNGALVKLAAFDRTSRDRFGIDPSAHAALVLRGGSCAVTRVELGDGEAIEEAAEAFARAMREERADERKARDALATTVLAPLQPALGDTTRWLVIPDGALWGVPLGVLPDPQAGDRYLFERVTIGYLTSTFELAEADPGRAVDPEDLRTLLVGAPDFGSGSGPMVLTPTGPCRIPPFEPLPATAAELEDISQLVGAPSVLTGGSVTRAGLQQALAANPALVHFATHAYFAGSSGCAAQSDGGWRQGDEPIAPNPLLLSGIVLAGANAPGRIGAEGQAGILTAYEVSGLDLRDAKLVVLSACDTGTGLQQRGQEVQGLRWGFRAAGARALVTSLWRSNDLATRGLMKAFYRELVSGDVEADAFRGAEALRRAQLEQVGLERRMGMQRPLTWANFVFSGVL